MKNFTNVLLILFLCCFGTITSQTDRPINELLAVLSQNHIGSVTAVFTLSEIQTIKDHFAETTFQVNNERALLNRKYASTESVAIPIAVIDIDPTDLSTIEVLGNSPILEFPGAGVSIRGLVSGSENNFIVDNSNKIWLRSLGQAPVTHQDLGMLSGLPPGHSVTGLELLPGPQGKLYGTTTNGVDESTLVLVDVTTRVATQVGGNNGLIAPIALARDKNENLITIDIDDDIVYGIDKTTGVASAIGPLGYDANFGQAMFYDEATQQIISLAYNGAVGDSEMRSVNPLTGASTNLGTIQPGTVQQFGWGTYYDLDLIGISEPEIDGFNFYPNPATDIITLNANVQIEAIEVYSILGQLVLNKSIKANTAEVNISQLISGTYILKVLSSGQTGAYKLIKK